jgi:hypothetical protein
MKFNCKFPSRGIFHSTAWIALGALLLAGSTRLAYAFAGNQDRSVQGRVVDDSDNPLSDAIVYLSDQRTLTVQTYITQQDGAYNFEQLSPNDDYKLWAQRNGKKSKTRILSSFDNRSTFRVIIKIDTGK